MTNTLLLVGWVLAITIVLGTLLAVLFDQEFFGQGVARLFAIAPFFVMPTVSALIWKNMLMHPVSGLFAAHQRPQARPDRILPHLGRAISVVVMIETIFFLTIFAEIFVTTSGGPGLPRSKPIACNKPWPPHGFAIPSIASGCGHCRIKIQCPPAE